MHLLEAWQTNSLKRSEASEARSVRHANPGCSDSSFPHLLAGLIRRLRRCSARALIIVSLLFGVFHWPGRSGFAAVKMVCTTFVWSWLFAYGFLLNGSLWTAVGLHVFGNTVLHHGLGLSGGSSIAALVLHMPWPLHYDPALIVWLGVSIPIAVIASFCLNRQPPTGRRRRHEWPRPHRVGRQNVVPE